MYIYNTDKINMYTYVHIQLESVVTKVNYALKQLIYTSLVYFICTLAKGSPRAYVVIWPLTKCSKIHIYKTHIHTHAHVFVRRRISILLL